LICNVSQGSEKLVYQFFSGLRVRVGNAQFWMASSIMF